jgi:hypothetical protein
LATAKVKKAVKATDGVRKALLLQQQNNSASNSREPGHASAEEDCDEEDEEGEADNIPMHYMPPSLGGRTLPWQVLLSIKLQLQAERHVCTSAATVLVCIRWKGLVEPLLWA